MEIVFITTLLQTAIVVLILAIILVLTQLFMGKYSFRKWMHKRPVKQTLEARAIVLSIEQTGLYLDHKPQVKMQMQVLPEQGRNFVAEIKEILSFLDLDAIKAGSLVIVKYNPANIKEVSLVKAA